MSMADGASEGLITFKASKQRPTDGGWTHMEISLPLGASEESIQAACSQWDAMERAGMQALNTCIEWYQAQAEQQAQARKEQAQAQREALRQQAEARKQGKPS